MDNLADRTNLGEAGDENLLKQYVESMDAQVIAHLSQPASQEVLQMMEQHVVSLLGKLPPEQFGVMITTSREHLGRLIAAAMLNGYFLRSAEQRMAFEQSLQLDAPTTDLNSSF